MYNVLISMKKEVVPQKSYILHCNANLRFPSFRATSAFFGHGVKVGPGPWDPGPPLSLKMGPQDPLQNLKVGPQNPHSKFKSGTLIK